MQGADVPRPVHVKVIKLSDSAAASSAWRELVMLLQVCMMPHDWCAAQSALCSALSIHHETHTHSSDQNY
jgi:hypothetical protein